MTMRSTLFANAGFKLDTEKLDFDKSQVGAANVVNSITIKRESCDFVIDVHDVHGAIHKTGGELLSKTKLLDQNYIIRTPVAAQNKAEGALVQGNNWGSTGVLSSSVTQMGGEGIPIKGKLILSDSMDNTELVSNNNSKDAGTDESTRGVSPGGVVNTASIELSTEGKWRNIRKTPANPHTQATCLQQILLLQLDLIEQQQQQLQSKDKEIDELKADKETLLARIERMERRLQLTRKDPRDKRLFQPLEPWTPDKEDLWDLEVGDSPQTPTPRSLPFSRGDKGLKRKFCFLDSKIQKSRGGKGSKFAPSKSEYGAGSPHQRELRNKETPEKTGFGRSAVEGGTLQSSNEDPELTARMEELPFMSTTEMYLCRWHQPPPSPQREPSPSPKKEEVVAIPSWRENIMEPLDEEAASVIPEMLDDSVFLKRHAKLELDEKRRKRWDIQRIREQRMFQRLQQRMNKKKGIQESEPEVSSFYPDTEDVESIIITPFLPVVAFGRPLPKLTQQWYHGAGGGAGRVSQKDLSSKCKYLFFPISMSFKLSKLNICHPKHLSQSQSFSCLFFPLFLKKMIYKSRLI
ncbi:male-specific lethal 1-like 1 isoform X1 [Oncorhynchus tshawytscha]|uniref:PEHE domain-containing protein n=2 Tax=Oncorhynchus tshawytscha TaxID=74940 RepID=A0AAZ3SRU6_ONCTS|nr:male-specific lethal 1-like 1 isoform X1 [Oncorhynchus tshawytscha]XP_024242453.1 male-specific lethal 1-like 1 isoform X1 [Oncorhynchus tshawytscha]